MAHRPGVERVFDGPYGSIELLRHPFRERSTLRAWDAADSYVLRHVVEHAADQLSAGPIAIINDGFGAIGAGLHHHSPIIVSDSAIAAVAIGQNLDRNGLEPLPVLTEVTDLPVRPAVVIIKVQKSLGLLEEQLHHLRPTLADGATIIGAGMVRDIHTSTLALFENIIGPTTTSLAKQKARLIHCHPEPDLVVPENPWPLVWRYNGLSIHNRGGVFSARSIDIGTRFLLQHLPELLPATGAVENRVEVVDLGSGNGVLGTAAAAAGGGDHYRLTFIDSSARAVDSSRLTWTANHGQRPASFHFTDRMASVIEPASVDMVVNNPPFHDERAVGDATAWDMFVDSHRVLAVGGRLVVVANRHLGHHTKLKKIFGNVETVASNRKFVILVAMRNA